MSVRGKVEIQCFRCHKTFQRSIAEFNRSEKLCRRHFCSRSCCGKTHNIDKNWQRSTSQLLKGYNKSDGFTQFRFFLKTSKYRELTKGATDLTLEYLKELWTQQKGICQLSGLEMILPHSVDGWKDKNNKIRRASLDRIDCSKGYIRGNVRFICWMANICRNSTTDVEMIGFCKAVAEYNRR